MPQIQAPDLGESLKGKTVARTKFEAVGERPTVATFEVYFTDGSVLRMRATATLVVEWIQP
jgi:hypothetical protein